MSHIVLARKWRPKNFNDLVGQDQSVTILKNIIANNRLHHAYLLTGTRGVGKTTIARIIAKALNCLSLINHEPCSHCNNCVAIDNGRFVDVIEIDAASNTGVDNIRELIDSAQYAPTSGNYKIYIIDEVHMLSKSAFNAMLKTLEEPPAHVLFILATTDPQKIPVTVLSRCLQLKLRNLSSSEIIKHLSYILQQEQINFDNEAIELIANAANSSMRDALSILDQAIAFSNNHITATITRQMLGITEDTFILELLDALIKKDSIQLVKLSQNIYQAGHDLENVLTTISLKLSEISVAQFTNNSQTPTIISYAKQISVNDVQLYFEIVNLGLEQIVKVSTKYPVFIMTLLRMLAFHIGSQEQKQTVIQNSNFMADINPKPAAPSLEIKDKELPKQFNGDWFDLIKKLEPQIASHLYPFILNAKLLSYTTNSFKIIIDDQYAEAFNEATITDLSEAFSKFFATKVELIVTFATKIDQTPKEKHQQEESILQKNAETAINNDSNLNQLLSTFSAKILPGSIKPLT